MRKKDNLTKALSPNMEYPKPAYPSDTSNYEKNARHAPESKSEYVNMKVLG